jgi:crotonobetainyl-CoA:carnitine CoA-transferase CaiB-like acyl-CoA transferase
MGYNYGKKSISLNLKDTTGQEFARRLAAISDVVVENFRPGVMARLGLDYGQLRELNPGIIFCSISGFGQHGADANRTLHAPMAHALSGIMRMQAGPPRQIPAALGDPITAIHAVGAICAALFFRERTGLGQQMDIALLDAIFAMMGPQAEYLSLAGGSQRLAPAEERSTATVPVGMFEGRDGYVVIGGGIEDPQWHRLATAMGHSGLADRPHSWRVTNQDLVYRLIDDWVQSFESVDEVERVLAGVGVVVGKVRSVDEAVRDPKLRERGMVVEIDDEIAGDFEATATAFHFSLAPSRIKGLSPGLGEHNAEIFGELLGLETETIRDLTNRGILSAEPTWERSRRDS